MRQVVSITVYHIIIHHTMQADIANLRNVCIYSRELSVYVYRTHQT